MTGKNTQANEAYQADEAYQSFTNAETDDIEFRSLSKGALASILFGILGISGFLLAPMTVLCLIGVFVGMFGLISVRKYPEELTGGKVALVGIVFCLLVFCSAAGMHMYIYMTEVPEGYSRINFSDLQPESRASMMPVSQKSLDIRGENVFIKGYVYPSKGGKRSNLEKFILVRGFRDLLFWRKPQTDSHARS